MRRYTLFLFTCFQLFSSFGAKAQNCEGEISTQPFSLDPSDLSDMAFLDTLLTNRNFIFTSEAHGNPNSIAVSEKFIIYLAIINKLDWIAIEADQGHGYALNQYFETGNLDALKTFLKLQPDFESQNKNNFGYAHHYEILKHWSDSLDLTMRFVGVGVCKAGFKGSVYTILNLFRKLSDANVYAGITSKGEKLMRKKQIGYSALSKWMDEIELESDQIRNSFESDHLNFEYQQMENIIFNVRQSIVIRSKGHPNREAQIAENFQRYTQPDEYVYSQYGYGHVLTNRWPEMEEAGYSFVDWLELTQYYSGKALIFSFSPYVNNQPEFALFGDNLCPRFKSEIEETSFPQIIDFRKDPAFSDQFQFAIVIEK